MIPKHLNIKSSSPFFQKKRNERKTKMAAIVEKINKVDQHLSRAVASYRSKNNKTPNELELQQDQSTTPLISQRKRLVKQYNYLKQEKQFAENTYKTIRDNPIQRAQKSFSGIRNENPFSGNREYRNVSSGKALSPIRRIGNNTNKQGTLWDPRFNHGDITVDPKIARYYKRLTGGY
ncbi:hypothetical protein N9998_00470 [Nitrosopumilus sp.]|nr:hypothetical protein [Nitrosopumilus sp.]